MHNCPLCITEDLLSLKIAWKYRVRYLLGCNQQWKIYLDLLTSNYSEPEFPTIQGSSTDEIEAVLKVLVALKVTKRMMIKQIARRSNDIRTLFQKQTSRNEFMDDTWTDHDERVVSSKSEYIQCINS